MAATVSVKQSVGAGPTNTSVTNVRHNTDDTVNPGTVNPLVKPAAGTNYGFWKTIFLNADTTPAGTINNVKIYSPGSFGWTGVTVDVGTTASYTQATGTTGTTGDVSGVATVDFATYTSGSPLSVTGSISNPSTGKITNYVVMQAIVTTSAVAGTLAAVTITWQYDET